MDKSNFINESFLGRGWSFPPTFDPNIEYGVEMVDNTDDIKQSLIILFNTNPGERIMLPEYGSALNKYLFDSISNSRRHLIREMIRTAILKFEPRITVNSIDIESSADDQRAGIIKIKVNYSLQSSNTRFNLVFPYYKVEGTNLPQLYTQGVVESLEKETIL